MFYRVARRVVWVLAILLLPRKVHHKERIPEDGALIVCANHLSFTDPVFLGLTLRRQVHFISKKELFDKPILGWLLRKLDAFPVDREGKDLQAIRTCLSVLKQKEVLGIFPEGTRVKPGEKTDGKAGVSLIAKKSGAQILPICIKPKYGKFKLFCKTDLVVGHPFCFSDLGIEKDYEAASEEIMRRIYALGEEVAQ